MGFADGERAGDRPATFCGMPVKHLSLITVRAIKMLGWWARGRSRRRRRAGLHVPAGICPSCLGGAKLIVAAKGRCAHRIASYARGGAGRVTSTLNLSSSYADLGWLCS
jgi:hypothetical protein